MEPKTTLDYLLTNIFPRPLVDETTFLDVMTPLEAATQLHHATENIRHLVGELKASLYDRATEQEKVLHTTTPIVDTSIAYPLNKLLKKEAA